MRVIVQRCKEASVIVDDEIIGKISKGYLILVGFNIDDNEEIIKKIAKKIINLRIFEDDDKKMNLDLNEVNGSILSVSQFTLYAKLEGRRPSFSNAMPYAKASKMYDLFNKTLKSYNVNVKTGKFGADMKVSLINDGPVTIIIDSEELAWKRTLITNI